VKLLKLLGVVEVLAHGVGQRRVLVEDVQVELVGPPVPIGRTPADSVDTAYRRRLAVVLHTPFSLLSMDVSVVRRRPSRSGSLSRSASLYRPGSLSRPG